MYWKELDTIVSQGLTTRDKEKVSDGICRMNELVLPWMNDVIEEKLEENR